MMEETPARISDEEVQALLEKSGKEGAQTVRPYDFAAQRINRTQLPLLEAIAKNFAPQRGHERSVPEQISTSSEVNGTTLQAFWGNHATAAGSIYSDRTVLDCGAVDGTDRGISRGRQCRLRSAADG